MAKKNSITKRQFQWALTIFVAIIVIFGGGNLLVRRVILPQIQRLPFMSNRQIIPFHEHHGLDPEITSLIFGSRLWPSDVPQPFLEDEVAYLPVAFIANFDRFLFWDNTAKVLTITTHEDVIVFHPGRTRFYINGFPQDMDHPILLVDNDVFMPACLAEALYPIIVQKYPAYNIVVVKNATDTYTTAKLTSRNFIRYRPDNRSPSTTRAPSGSMVSVFEEIDGFTQVRTEDGLIGWVPTSSIGELVTATPLDYIERTTLLDGFVVNNPRPPNRPGQPIMLAWDSDWEMHTPLDESLNIVAPTWFSLNEATMNLASQANREYVENAHAAGAQVWPAFYVSMSQINPFLTNRIARQRVIGQLVSYVSNLGLDGINIDFEPLSHSEGPYFIQFLRELAPPLGARGAVLSVNVAPHESAFYQRSLLAYSVDFVIVMAQDEYSQDGYDSGPVASLPFVRRSIDNLLAYVPREQLVLGLPFYNRIWREVIGDNTPETRQTRHFGTAYTREWFEYNGVEWEWLHEIGNFYGEFAALEGDEAVRWRVWLECERSMNERLVLFQEYNLAGVAVWNLNFRHNEELWRVMGRYFP